MAARDPRRPELAERIRALLEERPRSFYEVLQALEDEEYRGVLQAWGDLRTQVTLAPDNLGRYRLAEHGTASSAD